MVQLNRRGLLFSSNFAGIIVGFVCGVCVCGRARVNQNKEENNFKHKDEEWFGWWSGKKSSQRTFLNESEWWLCACHPSPSLSSFHFTDLIGPQDHQQLSPNHFTVAAWSKIFGSTNHPQLFSTQRDHIHKTQTARERERASGKFYNFVTVKYNFLLLSKFKTHLLLNYKRCNWIAYVQLLSCNRYLCH